MTENKLYKFNQENINDFDEYGLESPILLKDDTLTFGEVVDKLNEQKEEINILKSLIIDDEAKIKELKKENKKYKSRYNQLFSYVDANFDEYMTQKKLNERIRELENELELYRHYVEFVPSNGDVE